MLLFSSMEVEGFKLSSALIQIQKPPVPPPFWEPLFPPLFQIRYTNTEPRSQPHWQPHTQLMKNIKMRPIRVEVYLTIHIYGYHLLDHQFTLTNYDPEPPRPVEDDDDDDQK